MYVVGGAARTSHASNLANLGGWEGGGKDGVGAVEVVLVLAAVVRVERVAADAAFGVRRALAELVPVGAAVTVPVVLDAVGGVRTSAPPGRREAGLW